MTRSFTVAQITAAPGSPANTAAARPVQLGRASLTEHVSCLRSGRCMIAGRSLGLDARLSRLVPRTGNRSPRPLPSLGKWRSSRPPRPALLRRSAVVPPLCPPSTPSSVRSGRRWACGAKRALHDLNLDAHLRLRFHGSLGA